MPRALTNAMFLIVALLIFLSGAVVASQESHGEETKEGGAPMTASTPISSEKGENEEQQHNLHPRHVLQPAAGTYFTGGAAVVSVRCLGCSAVRLNGTATTTTAAGEEEGVVSVELPVGRTIVSILSSSSLGSATAAVVLRTVVYNILAGEDPSSALAGRFTYTFRSATAVLPPNAVQAHIDSTSVFLELSSLPTTAPAASIPTSTMRTVSFSLTSDCSNSNDVASPKSAYLQAVPQQQSPNNKQVYVTEAPLNTRLLSTASPQSVGQEVYVCLNGVVLVKPDLNNIENKKEKKLSDDEVRHRTLSIATASMGECIATATSGESSGAQKAKEQNKEHGSDPAASSTCTYESCSQLEENTPTCMCVVAASNKYVPCGEQGTASHVFDGVSAPSKHHHNGEEGISRQEKTRQSATVAFFVLLVGVAVLLWWLHGITVGGRGDNAVAFGGKQRKGEQSSAA